MTNHTSYQQTYPVPVGDIQTQVLLDEATKLERSLPVETLHRAIDSKVEHGDHAALRYHFIRRELRHRGVI